MKTDKRKKWEERFEDIIENNNRPVGSNSWLIRQDQVWKDLMAFIQQEKDKSYKEGVEDG